jgi:transposase
VTWDSLGPAASIDAEAVARAAIRAPDLPVARLDGPERDLRLLVDHRESLVRQRTKVQSKLRWLLHEIDPEISIPAGALDRYRHLDHLESHLAGIDQAVQVRIARSLVASCRELTRQANALAKEISGTVRELAPELPGLLGCGELTAGPA